MRHFVDIVDAFVVANTAVASRSDGMLGMTKQVSADFAALSEITANAYFFMVSPALNQQLKN